MLEIEPIARALLGEPNAKLSSQFEWRYGNRGSLSIDLRKNVWHDHETDESGGCLDLITHKTGLDGPERAQWMHDRGIGNGYDQTTKRPEIVATFPYNDEYGKELFQVVKFEPKDFRQRRQDKTAPGGYRWSVKGVRRIPYRLDDLSEKIEGRIFIAEGEKDVDTLWRHNIPATCNAGGAGKWHPELTEFFRNKTDNVVVLPDRDPPKKDPKTGAEMKHEDGRFIRPGQDHAQEIAAEMHRIGVPVRVVELWRDWPEMPEKGDVTDWFDHGGTADRLQKIVQDAPFWKPGDQADDGALLKLQSVFPINERALPTRNWIMPGLLMRRQVTVLVAPSGVGKSLLTLQLGIACAQGRKWSGWTPRRTFNVLFINSEDDYFEICRRLAAATQRMRLGAHNEFEIDQLGIADRFHIADAEQSGTVVAKFDARTKTLVSTPLHDQLIETIKANQIDVVFVDPFAETFEGDENSNSELKWAGALWRKVARQTDAAVCLVHHTKKYASGLQGDVDAARGAGALIGIARIVSTLFPMTPKEAEAMGVKLGDRSLYLRYDDAKANLNLVSPFARWFQKTTITLDNACGDPNSDDFVPGDEVGVLNPWKPETKDVHEAQIIGFFKAIDRGMVDDADQPTGEFWTFKKGKSGARYVGYLAQSFFKCDALSQAEALIRKWEGTRLKTIQFKARNGHLRDRVVSELSPDFPRPEAAPIEPMAQLFPAE
jgi:hypothetical protein